MVDFLLQAGVCETLISFITQVGSTSPRPGPQDVKTDAMKLSYKAATLLAPDEPCEALLTFSGKRAGLMARLLFDVRCFVSVHRVVFFNYLAKPLACKFLHCDCC